MTAVRRAQATTAWSKAIPARLEAATRAYDLAGSPHFTPLAELSHATEFDGMIVDSNVVVVAGKHWSSPATVYATLVYRDDASDAQPIRSAAAFPATVQFEVRDDQVTITGVDIDTSSFFE